MNSEITAVGTRMLAGVPGTTVNYICPGIFYQKYCWWKTSLCYMYKVLVLLAVRVSEISRFPDDP